MAINPEIEWKTAEAGIEQLKRWFDDEINQFQTNPNIRNAYSPITWLKFCCSMRDVAEGMAAVRLATEGKTTQEIHALTGMPVPRIAAFRAWNTR